jgi:hypothetical protein
MLFRCQGLPGKTVGYFRGAIKNSVSHTLFRFFETEGIAVMTMLISKYKIEIKEEPEFARETFEERYARITASRSGLTTT